MSLQLFSNLFRNGWAYSGILALVLGMTAGHALGQEWWGWNPQPEISARSAVLMNSTTAEIVFAKEPYLRLPPASTTKVLTALVALERLDPNARLWVSPQAASVSPSRIGLRAGEAATTEDLLYGLMLKSGNDAAETLAEAAGGSVFGFSRMMNARAWQIGARNSHFMNPHGLPNEDHYSTAYDMALIFRQAMNNPVFADIVRTRSAALRIESGNGLYGDWRMVPVHNTNRLLASYEGARGGKTGFTVKARRCFVGEVDRGGVRLIVAILNSPNSSTLWQDARTLLDYGFARYGLASPPPAPSEPRPILVRRELDESLGEEESDLLVRSEPVVTPVEEERKVAVRSEPVVTPVEEERKVAVRSEPVVTPVEEERKVAVRSKPVVTPAEEESEIVVRREPVATRVATARPAAPVEVSPPEQDWQEESVAFEPLISPRPEVVARSQRIVRTDAAARPVATRTVVAARPVMAASKPVAEPVVTASKPVAKPVVAAGKPVAKPVVAAGKPVAKPVAKPVVAAGKPVAKPVVAAGKPVAKPVVAAGKPVAKPVVAAGKPVAKPVVAAGKPVAKPVVAAGKPVAKSTKPLVLAMAPAKPMGLPDKASKLSVASSGKTTVKPGSVVPTRLEKRESVKVGVRADSAAKPQKTKR
jgi:D-alanyl-D-alanine carboxypeptidase